MATQDRREGNPTHADKEAASNTVVLQGQIGALNALRDTQQEHGQTLAKHSHVSAEHGKRLDRLAHVVAAGFAQVDENFVKVGRQLGQLHTGQERASRCC